MSLVVWLPLTKDLRQQGLSNVTVTNNGATFNSAGKLGGCYQFGTATSYLELEHTFFKEHTGSFSFALWVKIISWNTSYATIFMMHKNAYTWEGGICGLVRNGSSSKLIFQISNGSSYSNGTQTTDLELNKWYHICCTYNGSKLCLYQDGILISSNNVTIVPAFNQILGVLLGKHYNAYQSNCVLNDFRFYNHCLSPMEVKELAKGLVLHYPLNRNGWGQENLVLNSGCFTSVSGWTNNQNTTISLDNNELKVVLNQTGSTPGIKTVNTINFSAGTYTASMLVKITNRSGTNKIYFPFYLYNGSATVYSGQSTILKQYGDYLYEEATFTVSETINNTTLYILQSSPENGETWHIKWVKIEKGSIATPWCPNSSDTLATTMGLNSTTEYDCSGFCNNGTKNGTYSYTSDTPKYAISTNFSGTETIATATTGANILTLSCWAKTSKSSSTSQMMVADSASKLCCSFYQGNFISFYGGNSGYDTGSKCLLGSEYKENEWNHFVSVKTGEGTRDCYCNGVKLTPTTNDWWSTATGFWIGNRNTGSNLPFYGQICDVRAYTTALSADDVKSLYQNCATIDADGTIRGQIRS